MNFASLNYSEPHNSPINYFSAVEHSMFGFWGLLHENIFCLGLPKFLYTTLTETVVECIGLLHDTYTLVFDFRASYKNVLMDGGKNLAQKLKFIGLPLKASKYNQ